MRHRSGEAGTVVPVSNPIESKYFLAVWACYTARKSKCQSAKNTKNTENTGKEVTPKCLRKKETVPKPKT